MQVAADTIKASLDNLPGFPRTQIGFLTFDSTLHFYNLKVCMKAGLAWEMELSWGTFCLRIMGFGTLEAVLLLLLESFFEVTVLLSL